MKTLNNENNFFIRNDKKGFELKNEINNDSIYENLKQRYKDN